VVLTNPANSFSGELLVNGGVVQVRDTGVLGDTNGITRIGSQGTLELAGGIDYLTPETLQFVDGGVLLNGDGTNTLAALLQGRITTRTEAGTMLSLLGDLNLHEELLCVDGEGETVLSGNLTGDDPGLNGLDLLPTGDYEVEPAGTNLTLHIDHDGLHGWLLIGRGRQGWEFDADGQGAVSNVYQHLGTTNAFAPAVYSEALINDALRRAGLRADQLEIRIRRASDPAGTVYQEVRWLPVNQDVWHWDLDINPGRLVRMEIQSGSPGGLLRNHLANTRDVGANDHTRVFTWAWDGHANQKGFSYGGAVTNGVNGNTSFLWEAGNENHAMPYAEVYIRSVARAAGLVKKGNGTLTLSGDNAYATETCIEAGRVVLASNLALGASVTPTIVEAGAELALSGNGLYTVQEPLILDVMGSGGALVNLDGTNAYSGTISLAPLKPAIRSGFTGGDLGEGLDLDGNFVHAVNVRGPGGLQVRDALFAADTNVTGVVVQASREILNWQNPVLGDSGDDDNLEVVMQSIRWGNSETYGGIVHVAFSDLVPAVNYRLQLLFFEPTNPNRGYDVLFDGVCIYNDFTAGLGGNQGAVLTYDFMATQSNHAVILEGRGAPFVDSAPILQGLTLERDIPIARAPGHAVARVEAGTLILNGSVDLDGSELELAGAGDHQVDVALGGFGAESLRKSGGGTAVLNGVNTFMGEVVVEEGALVVTRNDSLGSMLGGTRVDPAGLLVLDGGPLSINEDLTLSGTLLNLAGTNTVLASAQVQAPPYLPGPLRIDVADGRLDVLPDVNLEVRDLVVDGAGDLLLDGAIHIYTGPITPSLNVLDTLVPGNYPFTAAGESFLGYVDHDGSDAWLLIGRGREGWEFDADGQGAITNVYQGLETTNAFAPAVYSEAVINELLAQSGVTMADIEVRIKRAADIDGLTYQESRWRDFQTAQWTWALNQNPVGLAVAYEILSGPGAGFVDLTSSTLDAWTLPGNAGNDATRLFTWAWGGHGSLQGFSYGGSVQGVDNNSPSTFMWEFAVEGHALPYSEIYIRSRRAVPFTIGSSLTKHGAGRLTLSAANEFLGDTIVHAGDLQVNNPSGSGTGSGMVLVAAGAGLGGSGSVSGPVTLTSGALLSPGNVIGTFTANGGLNVATPGAATTVTIELASPVLADQLAISGSVALQNMTLDVETVMGFTPTGSVTYTILTTSGGVTGTFDGLAEGATIDVGGTPFTIQYTGNDVVLTSGGTVPDGPLGLSVVRTSPGVYDVSFMGEATTPYTIEFTETLSPPSWQTIGAVQSDGTGLYGLQHTFSGPRGYYRSTFP
jgi:autotransporter-associated beta strand protein